jgi:hypothetical protein
MIHCDIYVEGKEDSCPLGGSQTHGFNFNTLPRVGDILWLMVTDYTKDKMDIDSHIDVVCTVIFAAQRSSNSSTFYAGYLVVKIHESNSYEGGNFGANRKDNRV